MRLGLALALTLLAVLVVEQRLVGSAVRQSLIEEGRADHLADATALARAARAADPGEDPIAEVQEAVDAIAARPGVLSVELVDATGRVLAAGAPEDIGEIEDGPAVRTARTGVPYAGEELEAHERSTTFEYTAPVRLPGLRAALEVDQSADVLEDRLDDVRDGEWLRLAAGLAVGVLLFFLVGGRRLARNHAAALDRALRDGLTDLRNHRAFQRDLADAFADARRENAPLVLVLLDLDDFKFLNDRHGHAVGDSQLVGVARLLRRLPGCAYRLGGDEFAVLLPGTTPDEARRTVEDAGERAREELPQVTFSAGLAELGPDIAEPEVLRERADAAAYEAKRAPGTAVVTFSAISGNAALIAPERVRALRRLLEEGRVTTAFQPIFDVARARVIGYEALGRPAPTYGFAGPGDAFSVAVATRRAHELCGVFRAANLAAAQGLPASLLLFLNVAPDTLERGQLSDGSLLEAVEAAGLVPEQVVLEITEQFSQRVADVLAEAERLRAAGFRLALDDVGAGDAGLGLLRNLPVDYVKIDRSVVADAVHDVSARAVLDAIVAYARRSDAQVIAEGIETEAMLALVRDLATPAPPGAAGVFAVQGYLLGRPEPRLLPAPTGAALRP